MDQQFTDEPIDVLPDSQREYHCTENMTANKFTLLMKWVLIATANPAYCDKIRNYLTINKVSYYQIFMYHAMRFMHSLLPDLHHIIDDRYEMSDINVNKQNSEGWTALMLACYNGNGDTTADLVKILIDAGADVNLINNGRQTALMYACYQGNMAVVKLLLDAGAIVTWEDECHKTALIYAFTVKHRDINFEIIDLLRTAGANFDDCNTEGTSVLMEVCRSDIRNKSVAIINLITAGVDVNRSGRFGTTALMIVCSHLRDDEINIVRRLIDAGARPTDVDNDGDTALNYACTNISLNNPSALVEILIKFIDINVQNNAGRNILMSYLHRMDQHYNFLLLETIIQAGIDINARCLNGKTVLMYAVWHKHAEVIVPRLLEAGAKIDAVDINLNTAFIIACDRIINSTNLIKILLDAGANINHVNRNHDNALNLVISEYLPDHDILAKVQLLINAGININFQNHDGKTALMLACKEDSLEDIVSALILAGADASTLNIDGRTAIYYAYRNRNPDIADLILENIVVQREKINARKIINRYIPVAAGSVKFRHGSYYMQLLESKQLNVLPANPKLLDFFGINDRASLEYRVAEFYRTIEA